MQTVPDQFLDLIAGGVNTVEAQDSVVTTAIVNNYNALKSSNPSTIVGLLQNAGLSFRQTETQSGDNWVDVNGAVSGTNNTVVTTAYNDYQRKH